MYYMSYHTESTLGFHLAESPDLLHWTPVNGGAPLIPRARDGSYIVRDPFLLREADGQFRVIFTNGWKTKSICTAVSGDLQHWSAPVYLGIMEHLPDTANCWAPECVFDDESGQYMLFWSSSFHKTNRLGIKNHRIWRCFTKDFQTFSQPELFFDPGFNCIDATLCKTESGWVMAFKDERGGNTELTRYKNIRLAFSTSLHAPFGGITKPVTGHLTEGPYIVQKNGQYYLFADCFMHGAYTCSTTEDFMHFQKVDVDFPAGLRHCSILLTDKMPIEHN